MVRAIKLTLPRGNGKTGWRFRFVESPILQRTAREEVELKRDRGQGGHRILRFFCEVAGRLSPHGGRDAAAREQGKNRQIPRKSQYFESPNSLTSLLVSPSDPLQSAAAARTSAQNFPSSTGMFSAASALSYRFGAPPARTHLPPVCALWRFART